MQPLQALIDGLEKGRNIHISVLDFSGVLNTPLTEIRFSSVIHAVPFCDFCKATPSGYRACMRCKTLSIQKAVQEKTPYFGCCVHGLSEAVFPVIIGQSVAAIVYAGNAVIEGEAQEKRRANLLARSGEKKERFFKVLEACERETGEEELLQIAELTAEYLKFLSQNAPQKGEGEHWLVASVKKRVSERFYEEIRLKDLAALYQKNEKYLGRLFKRETGVEFHRYCNLLRLKKAETLLMQSKQKIVEIALDCGFGGASYFNRLFKKEYGISPSEYRKKARKT